MTMIIFLSNFTYDLGISENSITKLTLNSYKNNTFFNNGPKTYTGALFQLIS
jgi:hypothetical protein